MTSESESVYPEKYSVKVVLRDGSVILFRPIKIEDARAWLDFYHRLDKRSIYLRFHRSPPDLGMEEALRFCTVDYNNQFAFVAEAIEKSKKQIVAVGRYSRLPNEKTAEIAFIIHEVYQEKGIGTKMIEWLATVARGNNIDTFEAFVLPENTMMLSVFQGYGFHMKQVMEHDVLHITFPLTRTAEVERKKQERAQQSTIRSLGHIMKPKSVAVIGASNKPGSIGNLIFQAFLQSHFNGVVYPVNPRDSVVLSVKAYPSVLSIQGDVELAVVAVPAQQVLAIADECGRKKVKGLIVISDGFREKDEEGAILERELLDTAFGYGMRIIGPNCMGVINTDPLVKLNATFSFISPRQGNIAFISQSGALGLGILQYAQRQAIGFSSFVSVGNRADIGSTDLLQFWEDDPSTRVILLYLESFDNPQVFSRVSKRISAIKPILAIKGGTTSEGSRATQSHTGAMATPGIVSDALFREAGIVMVNSVSEMFETAVLMANQPVPGGKRVAVLTNGGGPGIMAADACAHNGLELAELSEELRDKLKSVIKRKIRVGNPVDLTAGVSAQEFEDTLKILADSDENDAVMAIYIPPAGLDITPIENAIEKVVPILRANKKPLLVCFVGMTAAMGKVMDGHFIPYYLFPEDAALALTNAVKYGELRHKQYGVVPALEGIKKEKAQELVFEAMKSSLQRPLWLSPLQTNELLKLYGIRTAGIACAATAPEAALAAASLGFPVAVKLNSATIQHKTEVGGVVLDVNSALEAEEAFNKIQSSLIKIGRESEMQGVCIQSMVKTGAEIIVGVKEDATLGHVIMFGMGGINAELFKDSAVRLHPLTQVKARELIDSIKMAQLLKGYRGSKPSDIASVEDLLLRVSALVEDIPQIIEMDLNPVKVQTAGEGYSIVDARILIK